MQFFNHKKTIDLPNIRKEQVYKNEEFDNFDLLFNNPTMPTVKNKDRSKTPPNIKYESIFSKPHYFYFVTAFFMLVTACFLTVQIVVNNPDIEKYKAAVKDIEVNEPVIIAENKVNDTNVPDVEFGYSSPVPPKQSVNIIQKQNIVVSKKPEMNKIHVTKAVPKPIHVAVNNQRKFITESKINQAIAEIMLRPLTVADSNVQKTSGLILRGVH